MAPGSHPQSTAARRLLLLSIGLVAFLAAVAAVAVVARGSGSTGAASITTPGSSVAIAARVPVTTTTANAPVGARRPVAPPRVATPPVSVPGSTLAPTPAPTNVPGTTPAPGTTIAPEPTTTTTAPSVIFLLPAISAVLPPPLGAHVLTWTAPASLTIVAGDTATVSVIAHNPTNRAAALPHPLSCAPRLDRSEVCAAIVQLVAPHSSASAIYTIDTAGVTPGTYALRIEGVLTIAVIVSTPTNN